MEKRKFEGSITRDGAIRRIYQLASEQFNCSSDELYDVLHDHLIIWDFGSKPKLTKMSNAELSEVLYCFGESRFVTSKPANYGSFKESKQDKVLKEMIEELINTTKWTGHSFKKMLLSKYGVTHFKALEQKRKRGLFAIVRNYLKESANG